MRPLTIALAIVAAFTIGSFPSANTPASTWIRPRTILAQNDCQTFPETGKTICGIFLSYWRANGGLAQQGYPISDVFKETSSNGQTYDTQYFERAVFEHHPENAGTRFEVLLSLLGREKFDRQYASGRTDGIGRVGERVTRGNTALTVVGVSKANQVPGSFDRTCEARPGYTMVTIEVVIENIGSETDNYNRFYFGLKDNDGFEYDEPEIGCEPDFLIRSGELAPGEKIRGMVRYEVKEVAQGLTLDYSPGGEASRIRITLDA